MATIHTFSGLEAAECLKEYLSQEDKQQIQGIIDRANKEFPVGDKNSVLARRVGLCVLGCLIAVGGAFTALAFYQVLPHGVNAISEMGSWMQIPSIGAMVIGVALASCGALMVKRACNKYARLTERLNRKLSGVGTRMFKIIDDRKLLKPGECYAITNNGNGVVTIQPWNGKTRLAVGPDIKGVCSEWLKGRPEVTTFLTLEEIKLRLKVMANAKP